MDDPPVGPPVVAVPPDPIHSRLVRLREKTTALKELIGQAQARQSDPAYPLVTVTVPDNFVGYALSDLGHSEPQRAAEQLEAMEPMARRAEEQWRSALSGTIQLPVVPRYLTGPIKISGPSFLAQPTASTARASRFTLHAARLTRPVFFVGYGAFGQVRTDVEKFPDYGINLIHVEFGPASILPSEGETSDAAIRETLALLDRCAKANVAVNLLISPHYFPPWRLDKYPQLQVKRRGFLKYSLHAPEGQELLRRFLEFIIPRLKHHPALHSICLSNEPIHVEGPDSIWAGKDWRAWLQRRHDTIAVLNARWGTAYVSLAEVPRPDPFRLLPPTPSSYEFVLFNQAFFALWHRQMADTIHQLAPHLPVHAKPMSWTFFDENEQRFGVNADWFGELSQINGNDSVNDYSHGQSEWAQGWPANARGHEWNPEPGKTLGRIEGWLSDPKACALQRSVKDAPVFNSENPLIRDGETRPIPPAHVRAALWQSAVHGLSATTIWVWERTYDTNSDFAGSIMHRPTCTEAVEHTALDLLRLAEEVTALQGLKPQVALLHSAAAPSQAQADWPQFRGPGGLGHGDAKLPLTWSADQNLVWRTGLPGPGSSSPIVVGDRVFLTCYTGYGPPARAATSQNDLKLHVLCLDCVTGRILWDQPIAPELPEQERIRENHGYASTTPAADSERVYAFFGKTGVLAFSHDGRELWRAKVGSRINGWGSAASPVLHRDLVIVNASVESESLVALNKQTGKEAWRAGGIKEAWTTPLLVEVAGGKRELVVPVSGKVLAFDPDSGQSLWSCDSGIGWYMCPSAVAHEGVVYSIGGRSGGGLAVRAGGRGNVTASHTLWRLNKGSNVSSPVYHDGHLYFAHENLGIVYCVDTKTGQIAYEERLPTSPGMIYASPVLAGGRLYYVSRSGRIVVVAAKPKFEVLAQNDLSDGSAFNASPAIVGDRLLLRSDRFLCCLGER